MWYSSRMERSDRYVAYIYSMAVLRIEPRLCEMTNRINRVPLRFDAHVKFPSSAVATQPTALCNKSSN